MRVNPVKIFGWSAIGVAIAAAYGLGYALAKNTYEHNPAELANTFRGGFDRGVRYGFVAQAVSPNEDDIPTLQRTAWHWFTVAEVVRALDHPPAAPPDR